MPDIDAARLDALTKAEQLFNSMLDDPTTGLGLKKAIKEKFPSAKIPDLDLITAVTKPYDEKMAALEARNAALEAMINEDRQGRLNETAEAKLVKDLDAVRAKFNFTDEGMSKVLETMRERNLAHDPEAAAALVQSQLPKASPTSTRNAYSTPTIDIYGMQSATIDEKYAQLHSRPWDFFAAEVNAVMNEAAE